LPIRLRILLVALWGVAALWATLAAAQPYALLIKGGHVIDAKNGRDGLMDVAIAAGKIAELAPSIDASRAAPAGATSTTIRAGQVVWDLNGRAAPDWSTMPAVPQGSSALPPRRNQPQK